MAAAGVEARGLTTEELDGIRDALAAGRKPRVQFTEAAGQIAGQIGQVVGLADPAVSDEWVVVRFGRDELPFSPGDLRIAPKGAPVRKVVPVVEPEPEPVLSGPEFLIDKPIGRPVEKPRAAPVQRRGDDDGVVGKDVQDVTAPAPRKVAARSVKAKPSPSLTVTLAYGEGEWTVGATQGAKALAKPYVIRPAEALKMVQLIDVPGVQEAVEQILSAERAEAEQQAQRLRAELAEIEARLAELGEAGQQPS
ncbi:hypothetical protein ACWT_4177 [Actinoplanes sp. SE50]|uniref:hypothetical protein n=1 Tax=Actinoplanes sp. (strain ATCC 31044 / CBS 674.73 / SE50/110) TaxID=134676 RepID=UPI00023EC10E|nr:hypothetical protein ACPL_4306 [Actinoplanes sp. SE50/110]ATO83592.1 hypothetical protein ACWT_4177 [Actinoplanes sp. SE50]SLM00999.1 hypothetical protein ACSP50_4232 [Actinoplanes sp. SE50/110]